MSDSIKVAIKVRPLIKREQDENLPIQWAVQKNSIVPLDPELKKRGEGGFYFDHIFDMSQSNDDLFNVVAKPIVDAAVNGFNGTIFAYGQTSSGKTYTMMGSDESPGVIPLAIDYIFAAIADTYGREFLLRVSYLEIYNERINDLLDKNKIDLKIKEDTKSGQIVVVCKEEVINSPAKVLAMMKKGDGNRRTGETNMNERSSRSHTIFRITIESRESNGDSEGAVNVSQLNLVDLAGSERARQTGATGERFNEGRHINMSLSALGLVIMQLSECQDNPQKYVNFRDSKLTRILQASLGGNAMTAIICAVTPAALEETQCTLAFASRAKKVKNKPQVNEVLSDAALLRRYAKQMAKLEAELEKARSADVVKMESKLMEKERANQILEERIELLKKSIVCGNTAPEDESLNRRAKRRRTWGGSGTLLSKTPQLCKAIGLPTIKELDKTPEKIDKQQHMKRRQSIIQSLDFANQTFQTEFEDFELELIENERAGNDNNRLSSGSSVCDEEFFITKRPQRNVHFKDDIAVFGSSFGSAETTPDRKTPEPFDGEPASPNTPEPVLRSRIAFFMEEYNALRKDHRNLEEFAKLEKQMFVDDAVEIAMAKYNNALKEITEKYTKLEIHSSASDKHVTALETQLADSENSLKALKRENQGLVDELNKLKVVKPRGDSQTSEKENSSIFANDTYFEEMDVSNVKDDSVFINDTQNLEDHPSCDNSLAHLTVNRLDESKKSKEVSNAAYSEFIKQIGEKSSDELATVMQELINTKLFLEDENLKLQAMLQCKIREADDIKNDVREFKSGMENLQETIHLLTNENTDLTSKLLAEKQHAKEAEKSLQSTIAELNWRVNVVTEGKTVLENSIMELLKQSKTCNEIELSTVEEMPKLIARCQETIASLTAENEELSSNLMSKIEELDRARDSKAPPGEHECAYRELSINLSDRNGLLEAEYIELSNNLMEKIEEYDCLKEEFENFKFRLSSPTALAESPVLVDISMNRSNFIGDESSNVDSVERLKNDKETNDSRLSNRSVDDLLRLSTDGDNSLRPSIGQSRTNGQDLVRLSLAANRSIRNEHEGAIELGEPALSSRPTVDDLLQISFVADGSCCESNKNTDQRSADAWRKKAEMLQEQVNRLDLSKNMLGDAKMTSCVQCAHLAELNENRKCLKLEANALNQKLHELQEKFNRERADSELLRSKANEDINLSVCDFTFNGSNTTLEGNNLNVSFVEEKVNALHQELEVLRDKHDKLSDLYKEKCDEIDKLQEDACSRETTPTPTSTDSPRIKRSDVRLERIQTGMDKLRTDFRIFKKNIAGISADLQKFANEKAIMQKEIESLRAEKATHFTGTLNATKAEERIEFLENESNRLGKEIRRSNIVARDLGNMKNSLEAEVESLKGENVGIEEKIAIEDTPSYDREKIKILENEVSRLNLDIRIPSAVKEDSESLKSSLAVEGEFLTTEKFFDKMSTKDISMVEQMEVLENEVAHLKTHSSNVVKRESKEVSEDTLTTRETMKYLESEVSRLTEEINNSNVVKGELESTKLSLEAQLQYLKTERVAIDEKIAQTIDTSAQERIDLLENEVSRLNDEIIHSNVVKEELESAKSSLETEVQYLKAEKASTEGTATARERIAVLETELIRLSDEIEGSNVSNKQAESVKSSLEAEIESLKAEGKLREEYVKDLLESLRNLESRHSELKLTLERSVISGFSDFPNNNEQDNAVSREKLRASEGSEDELTNAKLEISSLKAEVTSLEGSLDVVRRAVIDLQESNSLLTFELEKTRIHIAKDSETEVEQSSYETFKEYEKMVEELRTKVQDITNDLDANTKETVDLNNQLTKLNSAKDELNDARSGLELEVTSLKAERDNLEATLTILRETLRQLEGRNSSLDLENEKLSGKLAELQKALETGNIEEYAKLGKSIPLTFQKHFEELKCARESITKEIKSLKTTAENDEFVDKSISELFALFVQTIMSKEQEIIKALSGRFEHEKRKLEEQNRQSCDAEKRATVWAKELEVEIERTQQDLIKQEANAAELNNEIAKLQNRLRESAHENQLLNKNMKVLESDLNGMQAELEKNPKAKSNVTLNSTQDRERLIQEAIDTREIELSARLRLVEKQSKEKLQELTKSLEFQKTRNLELTNNLDGLEANERQLKSIVDIKSNELVKSNNTIDRLRGELDHLTETYNQLTEQHAERTRQVDEITRVLKTKCDKLSEYKTKLETITPEYEHLKDQAAERQVKLEKYKSEFECMITEKDKQISSLKDLLDSEEIKSASSRKQLGDLFNRNTVLQTEITELRTKCEELERANGKLSKSMRNSTSKIRAEEEMEDLRDQNRILQRNLEGASNRIFDLQQMKTQILKELADLRGQYDAVCNENTEMKNTLSIYKASVNETIQLRTKYDSLLQENNRIALESEGKTSVIFQLENKLKECAKENKELDEEMEDMLAKINELRKENADLDDKLYAITAVSTDSSGTLEGRTKRQISEETEPSKARIEELQSAMESLELQRDLLRNELRVATKTLESLRNENSELRVKVGHLDRRDSLSCNSSRSGGSPALEAVRVDSRRRRSRTELFNQKRPLEMFEANERTCCGECRCAVLQEEVRELERDLVTKNGEIAAMEIRIQSENFPHMKRCKDLEEVLASSRRKCKGLESELRKLRESKITELSSECDKCRYRRTNKRDQSTQCLPKSAPIYLSGMSSGVVEDHIKMAKLQKDKETLKDLCRGRQKQILQLENRMKELEKALNTKSSMDDERADTDGSSLSAGSKRDCAVNSRQAMKENVLPTIRDNRRSATPLRCDWFN